LHWIVAKRMPKSWVLSLTCRQNKNNTNIATQTQDAILIVI
jgi:hypothetical protein